MGAQPDVIVGAKAIGEALGVNAKRVPRLWAAGAPIKRLGEGCGARYIASSAALAYWLAASRQLREASGSFG
jgi:hypothetical protein